VVATAEPPQPASAAPKAASATEGVPSAVPAPVPAKTTVEPPPTQSALRAMPALLEKPAGTAPQIAKPVSAKAVVKSNPPRRAKSLDDLIAQIMASR
jgi:hypothetical protein